MYKYMVSPQDVLHRYDPSHTGGITFPQWKKMLSALTNAAGMTQPSAAEVE